LDQDAEDLVVAIWTFNTVMIATNWVVAKMMDIRGLGVPGLEFNQDIAPEANLALRVSW